MIRDRTFSLFFFIVSFLLTQLAKRAISKEAYIATAREDRKVDRERERWKLRKRKLGRVKKRKS